MKELIRCNFHTHTVRCHHADGCEEDYCRAAAEAGFSCLGFSDHCPSPLNNIPNRMPFSDVPEHIACVRRAAAMFPRLKVAVGFEVECGPGFDLPEIREIYKKRIHTDYLVGACHVLPKHVRAHCFQGDPESGLAGVKAFLHENQRMIESGMFICMVHPDYFGTASGDWRTEYEDPVRALIAAAMKHDVYLEVNAYGMRKKKLTTPSGRVRWQYPQPEFWKIAAEMGAKAVVGMDAHRPCDIFSNWDEACSWAAGLGLTLYNGEMAERIFSGRG